MKTILLKIDEDNDIFEMSITHFTKNNYEKTQENVTYFERFTLDNVYQSDYGDLFDELNMAIEIN